jgi:hypothetical protein
MFMRALRILLAVVLVGGCAEPSPIASPITDDSTSQEYVPPVKPEDD